MAGTERRGWYRLSRRLNMRQVCEMANIRDDRGKVGPSQLRQARRWLRKLEARRGLKPGALLKGSGEKCWTTMQALREADPTLVEQSEASAERLEHLEEVAGSLDERIRILAGVVRENQKRIGALEPSA